MLSQELRKAAQSINPMDKTATRSIHAAEKLPVVFRKFKDTGEIIALFPTIPADVTNSSMMQSYVHVGQHGAASSALVYLTIAANPEEYQELLTELTQIYLPEYELVVYKKITTWMSDERRAELDRMDSSLKNSSLKTAAFTKKHYIAIANILKSLPLAQRLEIAEKFVTMFKADNPQFNKDVFLQACGC